MPDPLEADTRRHDNASHDPAEADTIAALATAPNSSLSVLRISGNDSLRICDKIFRCKGTSPSQRPGNTVAHGHVVGPDGEVLDEVLLLILRAPRSYTGEDTAEIQGHGGSAVTRRILQRCLDAGCRAAQPGEFTRRAFLNGRLDLLQAEAVQDLVRAETDRAATAAIEQLKGRLSTRIEEVYEHLSAGLAHIEAILDFPDDEMPPLNWSDLLDRLTKAESCTQHLLATWREGHRIRDGARVVLHGQPNVGKSSLFNRLLGHDRAIVSQHPGTTRDVIEDSILLQGIIIRIFDTAGLRVSDCEIEREGVGRSRRQGEMADLVVHVFDLDSPRQEIPAASPRVLSVLNKIDLAEAEGIGALPEGILRVSARTGEGIETLLAAIAGRLLPDVGSEQHAVISARHKQGLEQVRLRIADATAKLTEGHEEQLVPIATGLHAALETLGDLTGRNPREDLLDRIFSSFCIGK